MAADDPTPEKPKQAAEQQPADKKSETKPSDKADPAKPGTGEKKPPARNPLTDFFKRTLAPAKGTKPSVEALPGDKPPADEQAEKRKARSANRHPEDRRAPYDRQTGEWLRRAKELSREGDWKSTLELLQRIAEHPEDWLVRTEAGSWVSLKMEAERLRGTAPPQFLRDYRQQYGGLAKQLLAEALRERNATLLGRVASSYFHTEAGYDAANRLGSVHLDHGEFALAARWFAALWQAKAPQCANVVWRTKAVFALKQAGQQKLSEELLPPGGETQPPKATLAGTSRDPAEWISAARSATASTSPELDEWRTFYGSAHRTGVSAGGEPLLMRRWHQPLTESATVRSQLEQLGEDLADQGSAVLPTLFATTVAGKVIYRSLQGVRVLDADTGRLLWSTDDSQPLERMIAGGGLVEGDPAAGNFFQGRVLGRKGIAPRWMAGWATYQGGDAAQSPICHLLFRNANFGLTSSDGRQLFVMDESSFLSPRQPGNPWQWDGNNGAPPDEGSQITSYDLQSGRPLWEIGGAVTGEPFDPPLAGNFFFGPPTSDGGELFVVAEATSGDRMDQIRLISLDPVRGIERWSQTVAHSEVPIGKDVGRRWWTAQPAIDQGIIVCPTTVGWLVAVDRVTHSLLWGYRPAHPGGARPQQIGQEQLEAAMMVQVQPLANSWSASPPIISAGRVLYTPPELQTLVCLELSTGRELWTKPRGSGLYLAGTFGPHALVVGRDATIAYDIETGNQVWNAPTPIPSGRGVALSDRYYLPLSNGEVWSVALSDGKVLSKSYLLPQTESLGNLWMYRGMLLSLDVGGLSAFEQRDAVHAEVARRKASDPRNLETRLREAEMLSLERNYDAALEILKAEIPPETTPELRERRRKLLVDGLLSQLRGDATGAQATHALEQLAKLVESADEKRQLRHLEVDQALAREDTDGAFDACLALASDEPRRLIARTEQPSTQVQSRLWAAGRLSELLAASRGDARARLDERVRQAARAVSRNSPEEQRDFLELFGSHPAADALRWQLIERLASQRDFIAAEQLLLELKGRADKPTAARATERLARLMLEFGLPADAAWHYGQLEKQFADVPISERQTGAQYVQALRSKKGFPQTPPMLPDWQGSALRVERMGAQYVNYVPQELTSLGSSAPYFDQHRIDLENGTQRLEIVNSQSDASVWSLPLRSQMGTADGSLAVARATGHAIILLHRGVLQALSPVERRVLWTHSLDQRIALQAYYGRNNNPLQAMQQTMSLANRLAYQQSSGASGLAAVNERCICYLGRRSLVALDTATGETLWTYGGVRQGTLVMASRSVIYLRPQDGQPPVALRALDGRRLDIPRLPELLNRTVQIAGDGLLLPVSGGSTGGLRLYDPLADKDLWSVEFRRGALLSPLDDDRVAIVETTEKEGGRLLLLDTTSGKLSAGIPLGADDLKGRSELYVLADALNVYLVINKGLNNNFYSESVPFVRASGLIMAVDSERSKVRWKQSVTGQNLILERFGVSPLVLCASRKYEQKGKSNYWSMHLVVFDKLSGARLLDDKSASQPGLRSVGISGAERYVELRSYNDRIRLTPVETSAAEGAAGG